MQERQLVRPSVPKAVFLEMLGSDYSLLGPYSE